MRVWQAWSSPEDVSVTFAPLERIDKLRQQGLLLGTAVLIHEIKATTGEDAMTQHHQRMGWEPYQPMGPEVPCPRQCGSAYYPEGYGECPNCGPTDGT